MYPATAAQHLKKLMYSLLDDLESGYIANSSYRAERKRLRYEKKLRELLNMTYGPRETTR